ncbi:OmpA family protein [Maribacter arenosus]|uniref:OmpA family protein n=1 Tax=Maribacter arenosus TaxID=1854708 RepID=A0ABR7VGU1_9FLAO|nr:OmpA family protein [Maribacter arenosus]MBD0852561.1 OmpA family protein [Maribacter arenosus]
MKTSNTLIRFFTSLLFIFAFTLNANGQLLKKLGKRAERAAERTVERRVDRETSKKTDQVLDSILEPGSKQNPTDPQISTPTPPQTPSPTGTSGQGTNPTATPTVSGGPKSIQVYSKFDFVPGDNIIFFDDFSNDFIGDFPSKWNTNGSGEVVTINNSTEKWFEIIAGHSTFYIPDVPTLPEEYTIEFDIMATGLDPKTASTARLAVVLSDDKSFKWGNYARAYIPFCQYHPVGFLVHNRPGDISNTIQGDIRQDVLAQPHISVAVNKERFRLWVNENKYIDIPRFVPQNPRMTTLKFELLYFKDSKERMFIKNLKVAEGGVDLRRKLISEGSVSTNGILFDSGSANIQPQSMGIILQISQVLQQEAGMNLKIVGHTDADGSDESNMRLSKERAEAVKNALVNVYNIDGVRLSTEGKGESEPVGDNGTPDGKAQNRRVEFIKQ